MTVEKYLEGIEAIYREKPGYALGHDGSDGLCDCIGMCKGAIRRGGEQPQNLPGTNYAARYGISNLQPISTAQLQRGQVVLKARNPGASGYDLPEEYRKGGKRDTGDYRDYYHIGTVTNVDPLEITHMTSPTAKKDTSIGRWGFVGNLPQVSGEQPVPTMQAQVWSENGKPVNLRKKPTIAAALVDRVPCGDMVSVLSNEGDWCRVAWHGKTGYMMTRFLVLQGDTYYTVEIPHLTASQANALIVEYPGATMLEERG